MTRRRWYVLGPLLWALARPVAADPTLALLSPATDARKAIAIGAGGEVYNPDGSGAWVRTQAVGTASVLSTIGIAGGDVVAEGEGIVYQLAENGWSAIRLHQSGKATMSSGTRAVAAVKRQLYSLASARAGEPEKLALAPDTITSIGSGTSIVIAMARGLARVEGTKVTAIAGAPKQVIRLVDDRWAIVAGGAFDLRAGRSTSWPAGAAIGAATAVDDRLVAVATIGGTLELWTVKAGTLARETIAVTPAGNPVGVVIDRADRAAIALADGRILLRDKGAWTTIVVRDALPVGHSGSPPARSR